MCEFCQITSYEKQPMCAKSNTICVYVRRCLDKHIWLPLSAMTICERKVKNVKGNVKFVMNNNLFVDYGDMTLQIANPYDYEPENVEVIKIDNQYYIKGFEPVKKDTTKKEETKE